jgi:VCBS repeat protein
MDARAVATVLGLTAVLGWQPATNSAINLDTPWARHTITSGPRGADGVHLGDADGDGDDDVTSAWEQAGLVTVSLRPAAVAEPWPTVTVATHLHGVEDAIFADVDADGNLDVVSACECRRVVVHFAPDDPSAAWTSVDLTPARNLQRWIKVAVADIDRDGRLDIIGGGKANPATVGWFRAPEDPHDGSAWTYTPMSEVGWTMSLTSRDVEGDGDHDVVLSDKIPIRRPDGTIVYELRGSRWLENTEHGTAWHHHPIGFGRGEHKFLQIADFDGDGRDDVLDGASGPAYNRTFFRRNLGQWGPWEEIPIPQPAGVGWYQDVKTADLDLDGDPDLVFSYSHAEAELSGVVWLAAADDGTWQRGEISGPPGTKYDNVELEDVDGDGDLDVITSEQIDQLGVIWYENPACSEVCPAS